MIKMTTCVSMSGEEENLLKIENETIIEERDVAKYKDENITRIEIKNVDEIYTAAFKGWKDLLYVKLHCVGRIGHSAFTECENLISVIFGDEIARIGPSAFKGCKSLTKLTFPETLIYIDENAFASCTSLEEIDLSRSNVYRIGSGAFKSLADEAKYSCPVNDVKIKKVRLPETLTLLGAFAFRYKKIEYLEICEGTREFSSMAFDNVHIEKVEIYKRDDGTPFLDYEDYVLPETSVLWDLLSEGDDLLSEGDEI